MAWRKTRSFKGLQLIPFFSPSLSLPSSTARTLLLVSFCALWHPRSVAAASIFHQEKIAHLKSDWLAAADWWYLKCLFQFKTWKISPGIWGVGRLWQPTLTDWFLFSRSTSSAVLTSLKLPGLLWKNKIGWSGLTAHRPFCHHQSWVPIWDNVNEGDFSQE